MTKTIGKTSGGPFAVRKYVGDPFRPRPHLRERPKSRRLYSLGFCIRQGQCQNAKRCAKCIRYSLWRALQ